MRTILCVVAALLIGDGLAHAQQPFPTAEIPTAAPAYLAKVKTAAPEHIVNKASIILPKYLDVNSSCFFIASAPMPLWVRISPKQSGGFVPCEARILRYSSDSTSSRKLRDTTEKSSTMAKTEAQCLR